MAVALIIYLVTGLASWVYTRDWCHENSVNKNASICFPLAVAVLWPVIICIVVGEVAAVAITARME